MLNQFDVLKKENLTSDQENGWIEMAREGDLPAFNQLVLAYQDSAFRAACWWVYDEASAEDVVQSVFLAAYRRIRDFRGTSFRNWLLKMVRNACIDELRRRKRHPWLALEFHNADDEEIESAKWMISPELSPEETLVQQESWQRIEQAIRQLPDSMREVIVLIDIEELDYAEVASVLNIPLGTLKSRIWRARALCRKILANESQEPDTSIGSKKDKVSFQPPAPLHQLQEQHCR